MQRKSRIYSWGLGAMTLLALAILFPQGLVAQGSSLAPYRVGAYDVIQLSVWQQPELDRSLSVNEDGDITVPLIGSVKAAGRTLADLESEILQRIQVYHRNVTRVALEITDYNSKAVYVLGAVVTPGKFAVYPVPNVWQAIREAGGITSEGDLSRVRIYREVNGEQILETHNLEALMASEGPLAMPPLSPGESVEVPMRPSTPGTYPGHDGVYVLGEVSLPGIYRREPSSQDVLGFILQAGGHTEQANLGNVLLLRIQPDGSLGRRKLDLMRYLNDGEREQNPRVKPGDTIFVARRPGMTQTLAQNLSVLTSFVAMITSVATLLVIYRQE